MNRYNNIDYHSVELNEIEGILSELRSEHLVSDLFMRKFNVYAFRDDVKPHICICLANYLDVNSQVTLYVNFPVDFNFKTCSIYDYVGKILHIFNKCTVRFILPDFDKVINENVESNKHPDPMA